VKALAKLEPRPGMWQIDVPEPVVGPNDVLIGILRTSICGTDVHIDTWDAWAQRTIPVPMVTGHEYMGTVLEVGSEVRGIAVGDRVSGEGHITCGHCRNCRAGRRHLCRNTEGVGVTRPGAFAERFVLPASNVFVIPDEIPGRLGCDPRPVRERRAHGAVVRPGGGGRPHHGRRADRLHGGRRVPLRRRPLRRGHRREPVPPRVGPTHGCHAGRGRERGGGDLRDVMSDLGMTEGFDVGLEMSGAAPAFGQLLEHMNWGGHVALLGIPPAEVAVDWDQVIFKGLTLKGIYGREMFETWYKMAGMLQSGLDLEPVITHRMHADDYREGFDVMGSGRAGKVVLRWGD
jgi:threonine 3-dehydrogenase